MLYQTSHRELAADLVLKDAALHSPGHQFSFAPWWRMSLKDCESLAEKLAFFKWNFSGQLIRVLLSYNILPQKPTITDGLLLVLSTYYRGFTEVMEKYDDSYTKELLSRLEEYHAQHPEIPDLTQKED